MVSSLDPIRCAFFKHIGEEIAVISVVNKRTFVFHTSMVRFTVSYSYTLIDLRFLVGLCDVDVTISTSGKRLYSSMTTMR